MLLPDPHFMEKHQISSQTDLWLILVSATYFQCFLGQVAYPPYIQGKVGVSEKLDKVPWM